MSLSEIKNKLYEKEFDEKSSWRGQSEYEARNEKLDFPLERKIEPEKWEEPVQKQRFWQRKNAKLAALIAGGVVLLALAIFGVFKFIQNSFEENRVQVAITGPAEIASGKIFNLEVSYKNDNRASLQNALLRVSYPESFKPEENKNFTKESETGGVFSLGEIGSRAEGKVILSGKAYSPKGTLMYIKSSLVYQPSSFNSQFTSENQLGVSIISTPISLEILAPQAVSSGDAVDYQINYANVGETDFDGIRIKMDYPQGFSFSKSNPVVSEGNNIWYVGRLAKGEEGKIVVSGKLEGSRNEIRTAKAYIGTISQGQFVNYNDESAETKIAASPLSIIQTVNNLAGINANPGDTLQFKIVYKNEGDSGLRDVIVTDKLDSPVLDYTSLKLRVGFFDPNVKTITWKASDYPALKFLDPGDEGVIEFSVKIKNVIPVSTANDKNFVISSIVKIDSPDVPTPIQMNKIIAGNNIDIKLNSKLLLDVKGFYNDSSISNSGPMPPQVGKETTYTIHWNIGNVSNDLTDAKVEAVLPAGVVATGQKLPDSSNFTYNERDNTIVWQIGNIAAGEGVLTAPKELVFQIKLTPSTTQINQIVDILGQVKFSAKDSFTGERVSATADKKTTGLTEDSGIGTNYKVQP